MYQHSSCVVLRGRGLLIIGASGTGKSSLALALISQCSAQLVSDDQTVLSLEQGQRIGRPLPGWEGRIEIRGLGITRVPWRESTVLHGVLELGNTEERLPEPAAWQGLPLYRLTAHQPLLALKAYWLIRPSHVVEASA